MPGNTTSPVAALLAPLVGWGEGKLRKRDYDRQVQEAMRRASIEDEELGMKRQSLGIDQRNADRQDQVFAADEQDRARAAGEKSGSLARRLLARQQLNDAISSGKKLHEIDPTLWEEAGVDAGDYKSIQPYDPKNDPELYRGRVTHGQRMEEIDRESSHRLGELAVRQRMGTGAAGSEEDRRLRIANTNYNASLQATAKDMGDLSAAEQERIWQAALRRAGLDPMKYGSAPPVGDKPGEFSMEPGSGLFADSAFMRSIGIEP